LIYAFVAGLTEDIVGAVVSIVNAVTLRSELGFPAESVTLTVQLLCAPGESALNVTVLFPEVADVVALEQSPPYVIVPASVELNV
jgi:hypothetical protein